MKIEKQMIDYFAHAGFEDIPRDAIAVTQKVVMTIIGTAVAGAHEQGVEPLVGHHCRTGGKPEATIFVHGGCIPADRAAFINAYMARAVDYCDSMSPGIHIGASAVSAALAAAELKGGCSGRLFLAAVALGAELGRRLNLTESAYNGFDPTGVCSVFAATLAAGRILGLDREQMWNALALAFNTSGGSFQSNIDAALAVRCIQGWTAQTGITACRYAQLGITGPKNFLEGVYGYFHLFGKDGIDPASVADRLGERFGLDQIVFKKYPSCGLTQACTEVGLNLIGGDRFDRSDIMKITVKVPDYAYKLVGQPFRMGAAPRVNAQFSIQYCLANALARKSSKLEHFDPERIEDEAVMNLISKITVIPDAAVGLRGHTAIDVEITVASGKAYRYALDIAPGFPGNALTEEEHLQHFENCLDYAPFRISGNKRSAILNSVAKLETSDDVRDLITWTTTLQQA
jgi:2-methylcitrate dehydratase PrpD